MHRISFFIFLLLPFSISAQFTYVVDQTIAVTDIDGTELSMPWAGGLNATQYNTLDLDHDGLSDLVLFDRMANKVITMVAANGQYRYAPEYENFFPPNISNWILLRDYNCDGKKDLFTADFLGIRVYTNTTQPGGTPSWKQYFFYAGFPGEPKQPVLLTMGFQNKVNLQLQFDDLPSIEDADGDGDLDIFNVRFAGGGTVEYHQNLSKENGWGCDSLEFKRASINWGNFKECTCGVMALNGENCPTSGRTQHAGGKSLLAMDVEGDQKLDLLISEADCNQLFHLKNEGTVQAPVINTFTAFPDSRPINILSYPAVYREDVDFDGKRDLVFSPNIYNKNFLSTNLEQSNHFYKNTGTEASPVFSFVKDNFLQEHMIDVGDNAVPAFFDVDGDADLDLLVSRNTSLEFQSTIFLFENTGSENDPAFKLVNEDFLGVSRSEFYNLKIGFADMDANNTMDLVFTATSFLSGRTNLFLLPNKSQNFLDFNEQTVRELNFSLNYNENLSFVDVDDDGNTDILAGRGTGALQYWRNNGSDQLSFTLDNNTYLGLGSSVERQHVSCAAADLDGDGEMDLVYGDQSGILKIVSDFRHVADASAAVKETVFNPLLGVYGEQNLGGRLWPAAANLFGTTRPAIVTGNILGGIGVLRNDEGESLPDNPVIEIFPNPVSSTGTVNLKTNRAVYVQLLSTLGQQLSDPLRLQPNQIYQYKFPTLAAGLYLLRFSSTNKSITKRLVIKD
jgi:hypothetical protein